VVRAKVPERLKLVPEFFTDAAVASKIGKCVLRMSGTCE
jgi:hypothetical protein